MPKLPSLPDRKIIKVLERNGLEFQRNATHGRLYIHPDDPGRRAEVPKRNPVGEGVLKIIIRSSKKEREEFENL